ncbi:MAG: hypothetical protein IPM24_18910 [Bryobacterales bacterium]|nr:hypothetical protein [Bryobacterales bacterium]
MPRNDDGEFELVLGNRQLLSGFFIVVVLFGVFFTMGYIVGRQASPAITAAQPPAQEAPPDAAKPAVRPPSDLPPGEAVVSSSAKPAAPAGTQPARETGQQPPPPRETASAPPPKPVPPPPAPPPAASTPGSLSEPPSGVYLQVAAPAPEAGVGVVNTLKAKGMPARLAPGPDASTVRVVVGPLDGDQVRDTRTALEASGFKPFLRKY